MNLKSTQVRTPTQTAPAREEAGFSGGRPPGTGISTQSPESRDSRPRGQKSGTGSVRNPGTLPGVLPKCQSEPLAPPDPRHQSERAPPQARHRSEAGGIPLPPPALGLAELQPRPPQPSRSSPWAEAPAGPPHRLLPSPLTGRPRSVLGGGPSREHPAAALRRGRLDARPGRGALGRQGASTTGRDGAGPSGCHLVGVGRTTAKEAGRRCTGRNLTGCLSAEGVSSAGWAEPPGLSLWWGGAELNGQGLASCHGETAGEATATE